MAENNEEPKYKCLGYDRDNPKRKIIVLLRPGEKGSKDCRRGLNRSSPFVDVEDKDSGLVIAFIILVILLIIKYCA